eukprot:9849737-Ditylum_brightwellii.AAC.1
MGPKEMRSTRKVTDSHGTSHALFALLLGSWSACPDLACGPTGSERVIVSRGVDANMLQGELLMD